MPQIVQMPDGTQVDMEGAPPEAHAALRSKIEQQVAAMPKPQEEPGLLRKGWDAAVSGVKDLARGAGNAIAGPLDTALFTAGLSDKSPWAGEGMTQQAVKDVLPTPKGDSATRSFVRAGLEGIGGAALSGPRTAVNYMAGAGAGVGGEVGNRLAPGNPLAPVLGAVAGGIAGGGAGTLATMHRPQTAAVAREALEGITDAQLKAAQAYKAQVAAKGLDIDLAQALVATSGHGGNLESIRNFLAGRTQGDKVQKTLRQQPEQLGIEAQLTAADLPGKNFGLEENANNLQQTASERLKAALDSRSASVKGLYAKAKDLPSTSRASLINTIQQDIARPGASEVLKARGKDMIRKLSGQDEGLEAAVEKAREGVANAKTASARTAAQQQLAAANEKLHTTTEAPLRALDVDTWINELRGPWQGVPLKVAYPKEQGQIKGLAGMLNQQFQQMSPEVRRAEGVFKQITEQSVNPLKQGPVGRLSQPHGFDPATQATVSKFEGMMNTGSDVTAKVSTIRTAAKELAKVNPDAFESSFKGWVSRKVQSAMDTGVGEHPLAANEDMAARLSKTLFDSPLQWQGLKDATATMAEVRGLPPDSIIKGLENLRQLTKAMQSRPSTVGGVSPSDFRQLGSNSSVANAVRVFSFLPVNKAAEAIERSTLHKTLSQLDTILTSPEGADMLIKLGRVPVMSKAAQTILGTWGGAMSNSPGLPTNNPPE